MAAAKDFQTPASFKQSGVNSTAFTTPNQPGHMPARDSALKRHNSEGPFANRFYQATPFTRRNFSVRTESGGVSACMGVSNSVAAMAPANHPHLREKPAPSSALNTTAPPEVAHFHDKNEFKKYQRYTQTFGSTIFAGYNAGSA